jgi:UDP-N-acetylglucosamine:LPS N-acetylglucosamine transferase
MQSAVIHDRYELLMLLSGPEPQRTQFEKLCRAQAMKSGLKTLIVRGKPDEHSSTTNGLITEVPHLQSEVLKAHFEQSTYIVCRSGHTSMMDLACLQRTALCIPTPGQTEQEYLGKLLSDQKIIVSQKQSRFDLQKGLKDLRNCIAPSMPLSGKMEETLDEFLASL